MGPKETELSRPPPIQLSDAQLSALSAPLSNLALIRNITLLLKLDSSINLYVVDRQSKTSSNPEDGLLHVGENDTLQVRCGPSWLAVGMYPGRFQLIAESFGQFREAVKKYALEASEAAPENVDTEDRPRAARIEHASDRTQKARALLRDHLIRIFDNADFRSSDAKETAWFDCESATQDLLMREASEAGFTISKHHFFGNLIEGIEGNDIALFLRDIFSAARRLSYVIDIMKSADREKVGPYAVFFDRNNKKLFILVKSHALQFKRTWL